MQGGRITVDLTHATMAMMFRAMSQTWEIDLSSVSIAWDIQHDQMVVSSTLGISRRHDIPRCDKGVSSS